MGEVKSKKSETITLPWANKIRERLKIHLWSSDVALFIKPILDYAEAEEKRINQYYNKKDTPTP